MEHSSFSIVMNNRKKPFVRWWWFADRITKEDILFQIEWMKNQGFGGVEICWVYPSKPDSTPEIFLSENWINLVSYANNLCNENELVCDFTFGTLWPFGGSWVDQHHAQKHYTGLSPQRIRKSWESAYTKEPSFVMDHLTKEALTWYADPLLSAFSQIVPKNSTTERTQAFFCDSLELDTEGLWTDTFDQCFLQRYGYSILPYMDQLDSHPIKRFEYRQLISELLITQFFDPFAHMCKEAGMLSRVQAHGALTDIIQAYASCDIPESEALLFDPEFSLIPASAALLGDKHIVSCEAFTTMYGWVPSPNISPHTREEIVEDLKLIADALFACGVNHIIWHGMPFNGKDEDKDFYASVYVGPHGSLTDHLLPFNHYMEYISDYMQRGVALSKIGVYFPVEDMQMLDRIPPEMEKPSSFYYWEFQDLRVPKELEAYHPLWISTHFLQLATVDPITHHIKCGKASYEALYVDSTWLTYTTVKELVRLAREGGLIILKKIPQEPKTHKSSHYEALIEKLLSLTQKDMQSVNITPCIKDIEGQELPLYFAKIEGSSLYLFIAHPDAKGLRYPLPYGKALLSKEQNRTFHLTIPSEDSKEITISLCINFAPGESKLYHIDCSKEGKVTEIMLPQIKETGEEMNRLQ